MNRSLAILVCVLFTTATFAQEHEKIVTELEQQSEILASKDDTNTEDDSFLQHLAYLRQHPINLNAAHADDLRELLQLTELQIANFLNYRRLMGSLLDVYELQAVPSWNLSIIRKLLPFITVVQNTGMVKDIKNGWQTGNHDFLIKTTRVLEKAAGYNKPPDSAKQYFAGSPNSLTVRYKYKYRDLLRWGVTADKDAGELFFKGKQSAGFDFYSVHLFVSRPGFVKNIAIGDFTVNMGQGLIQWQQLAFSKSPQITSVKRQSAVLHPYTSTGEINFHRGAGVSFQKNKWESTLFISSNKIAGNLVKDSIHDAGHITSLLTTGYYRTAAELQDRKNVRQFAAGFALKYESETWHLGFNAVYNIFSLPLKKEERPYNLFAPSGKYFENKSLDYSYTYKNLHFFGEFALDANHRPASLNGLLASLAPSVDLSILYRSINRGYTSFNANAFTENTYPNNEKGLFAGLCVRLSERLQLNAYADYFRFPWLKYRVDAPSSGNEYFIQLLFNPNKQVQLTSHFKNEVKQQNGDGAMRVTSFLNTITKQNWRLHTEISLSQYLSVRSRAEIVFYNKSQPDEENGFLMFTDILYKTHSKRWSGNGRLAYFETSGYNSRLYAFENDVLNSFSVPALSGKGYRYYLNINVDLSMYTKRFLSKSVGAACWMRFAQTIFDSVDSIGTSIDAIKGRKKTELKVQMIFYFK